MGRSVNGPGRSRRTVRLSRALPGARFVGCREIVASDCRDEASECRPGDLFVARVTASGDGHECVPTALARGAVAVVAERMVPAGGMPLCLVPDSSWAHARICHALAGDPSHRMRTIAIAGTGGTTASAWLAAAALVEGGHRVGLLTDLGCLGPDDTAPAEVDLASPAAVAGALARLLEAGSTHAILEVPGGALARHATAGMAFDTVAVTSLAADRGTAAPARHRLHGRLIESLAEGGCLVTDPRCPARRRLAAAIPPAARLISAGLRDDADVHGRNVAASLSGRTFLLAAGGRMVPVTVDTPTVPFVRDAVLAAAIALRHGVDLEHAARGIEAAGCIPGRMERVDRGQDAAVFVDTPSSMHAVEASLASLRRLTRGRLVLVADAPLAARLAGRAFQRAACRWADACLLVPASIVAAEPSPRDLASYARLDRLLGGLRREDCAVVLGPRAGAGRGPLAALVDGWLQLAHPAAGTFARRPAA